MECCELLSVDVVGAIGGGALGASELCCEFEEGGIDGGERRDEEDAEGWMECACGTPAREADRDREAGEEFALW